MTLRIHSTEQADKYAEVAIATAVRLESLFLMYEAEGSAMSLLCKKINEGPTFDKLRSLTIGLPNPTWAEDLMALLQKTPQLERIRVAFRCGHAKHLHLKAKDWPQLRRLREVQDISVNSSTVSLLHVFIENGGGIDRIALNFLECPDRIWKLSEADCNKIRQCNTLTRLSLSIDTRAGWSAFIRLFKSQEGFLGLLELDLKATYEVGILLRMEG